MTTSVTSRRVGTIAGVALCIAFFATGQWILGILGFLMIALTARFD